MKTILTIWGISFIFPIIIFLYSLYKKQNPELFFTIWMYFEIILFVISLILGFIYLILNYLENSI
jgi:hypothetical protein